MSYVITTPVLTKKDEKRMLEFFGKELRHYDEIIGEPQEVRYVSDLISERPYIKSKSVGFWYNAGFGYDTFQREYYYTILKWIAIQVGRERSSFDGEFTGVGKHIYTTYDEYEFWPVLLEKPKKKEAIWRWVDKYGIKKNKDSIAEQHVSIASKFGMVKNPDPKSRKGFVSPLMWSDEVMDYFNSKDANKKYTQEEVDDHRNVMRIVVRDLYWDKVLEGLAPIKKEMRRLDKAWRK